MAAQKRAMTARHYWIWRQVEDARDIIDIVCLLDVVAKESRAKAKEEGGLSVLHQEVPVAMETHWWFVEGKVPSGSQQTHHHLHHRAVQRIESHSRTSTAVAIVLLLTLVKITGVFVYCCLTPHVHPFLK